MRARMNIPVRLSGPSLPFTARGQSVDVSRTGMFVVTRKGPPVGTAVDLELRLGQGGLLLQSRGIVTRQSEAGVGIHFTEVEFGAEELFEPVAIGVA